MFSVCFSIYFPSTLYYTQMERRIEELSIILFFFLKWRERERERDRWGGHDRVEPTRRQRRLNVWKKSLFYCVGRGKKYEIFFIPNIHYNNVNMGTKKSSRTNNKIYKILPNFCEFGCVCLKKSPSNFGDNMIYVKSIIITSSSPSGRFLSQPQSSFCCCCCCC